MLRSVASKVMWIGRATIFMVGLAVVLFLTLAIVAQAADAARVPALKKGVVNTVKSMTTLVGTLTDPILKLDNNGTGPALQLEAGTDRPPLTVNAAAGTATDLSADELDGIDKSGFYAAGSKVADADTVDGKDSSGFIQGQGRMLREAKAVSPGIAGTVGLFEQSDNPFELAFQCPNTLTDTGTVVFYNKTSGQANLFSDNGESNPVHRLLSANSSGNDSYIQQTAASGEFITFQMQSASGKVVTVWFSSVNRQGSNDCHVQAQALIGD